MSRLSHRGILLAAGALALAGCDGDDDARFCLGDPAAIVSIAEGNRWNYRIREFDSTHTLKATRAQRVAIVGDTVIDSETWYRIDTDGDRDFAWTLRDDGLWVWYEFAYPTNNPPFRMAKFPAVIGDFWVIEQNGPDYAVTVVDTAAVVSVPAGVFWTHHYRMTNETGDLVRDIYYAPGLGRVYEVTASTQPNPHTHVTELTDFSSPNC
ncbi:MAG TPA: hypothetical protein VNN55_04030 [bacterium]|nr:hypothetical protein [bacterium]